MRADQQASLAQASRLATASVNVLEADPELALLLAVASANSGAELGSEQRRALHAAIDRHKTIHTIDHSQPTIWATYARLSPDASKLAVTGDARAPLEVYALSSAGSEFLWTADEIPAEWAIRTTFTADSKFVLAWAIWPVWDRSVPFEPDDPTVGGLYVYDAETGDLAIRPQGPECAGIAMYGIAHGNGPLSSSRRASSQPSTVIPGWCMPSELIPAESTAVFTNQWWLLDPISGEVIEVHDDDRGVWRVTTTDDASLIQIDYVLGTEILDRNTGELYPIRLDYSVAPWATLSPGGRYLFFGDRLLDPRSGEELTILEGGRAGLDGCDFGGPVFSSDDSRLMFGCEDGSVRIFSSDTGEEIERLRGHAGWAVPGSFDASGEFLASGSADGFVREWDISPRAEISSVHLGTGYYADSGVDLSGDEGAAIVYPTETETLFNDFFSTMTRHAVGELVLFDLASGEVTHRIEGVAGKVARISPDGTAVVAQTADERGLGDLAVFNLDTGAELYTLPGLCRWKPGEVVSLSGDSPCEGLIPLADATDLVWSPDGRYIAMSAGASQRLLVWDTATRALEFVAEPAGFFPFSAVAYSPDGSVLAVSSKTGMWVYDAATWDLIATTTHTGRPSWVMRFTSDGSSIITAQAHSGDVRIYDTATWEERNIRAGIAQTRDMAVSKDETMVAVSSSDGSIHLLDLETGALLDLISLENRDITNIEFIDGDTRLLISHATGPLEILTLDIDELVRVARSRISRSLTDEECSAYLIDPCPTLEELQNG